MTVDFANKPDRKSLRRAMIALAAFVVLMLALGAGLLIGAKRSAQVNAWFASSSRAVDAHDQTAGYWTCGMHPWVILPGPGLCPICHMDLTPLDASKLRGELSIDPVVVQNMGVRIAPVTTGSLTEHIRTVGTVVHDETTLREINVRFDGWIEKLHVDFTGAHVHLGEPLFDVYSPDLSTAEQDLLLALGTPELEPASRERLSNYGLTDAQIDEVIQRGTPAHSVTYLSPVQGHVIAKDVYEGMHVGPGTALYRIADHRHVWVNVTVYESQMQLIKEGMPAQITLPFMPNVVRNGRVTFIQPHLDPRTHQLEVRVEIENQDLLLKPGMFATVDLTAQAPEKTILVPREAVITTGARQVAFVSVGEGRFEPRDVVTGYASAGRIQVLEGLAPGEMVVTSGQFLLDSESRMREALAKMVTGTEAGAQRPSVHTLDIGPMVVWPPDAQQQLADVLHAYLDIGSALTNDSTSDIRANAERIAASVEAFSQTPPAADSSFWHALAADVSVISENAHVLADSTNIGDARLAFGHLSDALDRIVSATGVPASLGIQLDRRICGMAPDVPRSGVWLQPADQDVRNPYFGAMMLRCNLPSEQQRLPTMHSTSDAPGAEHAP